MRLPRRVLWLREALDLACEIWVQLRLVQGDLNASHAKESQGSGGRASQGGGDAESCLRPWEEPGALWCRVPGGVGLSEVRLDRWGPAEHSVPGETYDPWPCIT